MQLDDADWLDLAQISDLVGRSGRWKSERSVRLLGADASTVPAGGLTADPSVMPGWLRVVGVWHDDVIDVEAQGLVRWGTHQERDPRFTLPAPAGGWDVAGQSTELHGLEELRASGKIVRDGWLRDDSGASILRVAASDVEEVERVLAAQLPRRLYVVQSRYTAAQLREVEEMLRVHARQWDFEAWSCEGMDAQCQPYADVELTRISADLAGWASTLPDGLLTLHPAMVPAD